MEKIIFSNSFNQTEFLRTLAKHGINTFGLRLMSDVELCFYILEHQSKMPNGKFISSREEDYIYYSLGGNDYHDAQNLRIAIDSYRDSVRGDILQSLDNNLSNNFPDKKKLIKDKYQEYEDYKATYKLYDKNDLINFIINNNITLDAEVIYYKEYGITKVFLDLLNNAFPNKVIEKSILDDFPKVDKRIKDDLEKNKKKNIHFVKAYGKPCEADYVLSQVQKFHLDECQIVLTSSEDALEICKTADMLGIPYTTSLGRPVISTNAGVLLSYLFKLEDGLYGVDAYRDLFNCSAFNKQKLINMIQAKPQYVDRYFSDFNKYVGWLRLGFDNCKDPVDVKLYDNDQVMADMLNTIRLSLAKGYSGFIKDFIKVLEPNDEAIIANIESIEKAASDYNIDPNVVLKDLLNGHVNAKIAQSGQLFITSIDSAISSLRKHTFIVGLDSSFPGGPKDNYLIFDDEFAKTGSDFYNSKEIIKRKENILRALISACGDVYLSYPYFELAALEDNNPSSVFFDLFNGDIDNCPSYGFKDLKLVINKEVYEARLNNKFFVNGNAPISVTYDPKVLLKKTYYASGFKNYFDPKHKFSFLLSNILGISVDDEDDPYKLIASNSRGDILHSLMEKFEKSQTTLAEFLNKASKDFDDFIRIKPAVIASNIAKEKADFLRLAANLFTDDPGNTFIAAEEPLNGDIEKINFKGRFDRIEKDQFGQYILVDYKMGRSIEHKPDDPVTCVQGLIYSYLINNSQFYQNRGITISKIEFRYPDVRKTIPIRYNATTKAAMIALVKQFKADINSQALFDNINIESQDYIDKYAYLLSLFERMK